MTTTVTIPRITTRALAPAHDDLGHINAFSVDKVNRNHVYACGGQRAGTVLLSVDGGKTWQTRPTPGPNGLRHVDADGNLVSVVGQNGLLAVSDDRGFSWMPVTLGTSVWLDFQVRGQDGSRTVVGDNGFVAHAPRGLDFSIVDTGARVRYLHASFVDGRLTLLGYDGRIRVQHAARAAQAGAQPDGTFHTLSLRAGKPLTKLLVTAKGTWIVIGDGGSLFRSADGGQTFTRIGSGTTRDLEGVLETKHGLFVVGDDATILLSTDDGVTFAQVENDLEGHLWSIVEAPAGILVGGDEGRITLLELDATAKVDAPVAPLVGADDEDDENEDENEDEDEDEESEEEPTSDLSAFGSLEDASARWIREGQTFMRELNRFVERIYSVGVNKAGPEPKETREDMALYVMRELVRLNAEGNHKKARELFPPAYEPFDYDDIGQSIQQLARLADGRTVVTVGGEVYFLERDRVVPAPGVRYFALSADRRLCALGFDDHVEVREGWDGPVRRTFPLDFATFDLNAIALAPDGDALLVATGHGVDWITEHGVTNLLPDQTALRGGDDDDDDDGDDDGEPSRRQYSYVHAAISPNGRFVALGCQDGAHELIDRKTGEHFRYDPVSSYPHYAFFHPERPEVLFNSCHALYGSGSLVVSLDAIAAGKKDSAKVIDRRAWVHAATALPKTWLLGDRGGYIWALDAETKEQLFYLFVGSTITSLDVSPDKKTLLVGSYAGYVIEIDLTADTRDPMLLTNGNVRETARWVFWRGHAPMIW